VAVLPFDNIGNDPANEAVAEGLMDSLTSKLSNLDSAQQSLWVVPSSAIVASDPSDKDVMFEPTASKIYRHPTFYDVPDDVGHM